MNKETIESMNPEILLSLINTKLRNNYNSLNLLCEDNNISAKLIESKLNTIGYSYNGELNQFKYT